MNKTLHLISLLIALCTTALFVSAVAIFGIPDRIAARFVQPAPLQQEGISPVAPLSAATTTIAKSEVPTSTATRTPSPPKTVQPAPKKQSAVVTPSKPKAVTPGPLIVEEKNPAGFSTTSVFVSAKQEDGTAVPSSSGSLNQSGILSGTNAARIADGKKPLVFNKRLAAIAEAKALDMIEKKYFAHVSPTGVDIEKLAATYGYAYLNIGENLALGDFRSSDDVVTGWMNSPGHRANILNDHYTEIGIAAMVGEYEGRSVWFAVQEFGRPLSDCPPPDELLKTKIDIFTGQLKSLEISLNNLKAEIEAPGITPEMYNAKAHDYNTLVALYNDVLNSAKVYIADFNKQAEAYNVCVGAN